MKFIRVVSNYGKCGKKLAMFNRQMLVKKMLKISTFSNIFEVKMPAQLKDEVMFLTNIN